MSGPGPAARDVARQPEALLALAGCADAFQRAGAEVLRPGAGGRVLACGCGDGYFAARAAARWAFAQGLDWRAVGSLDAALEAGDLRPGDRLVAVSMSGNVDRTVEAARAASEAGVPVLALVNGGGGRLAEIAAARVSLELPDLAPFLCGTASYTATVAALMLLASGAAGTDAPDLEGAAGAQRAALDLPLPELALPTGARMLSAGAESGTARYGAAKLVELTRVPAWHADLEEFAHSQFWAMPATDLVVMIVADPVLARRADEGCDALARMGVRTLAVDTTAALVPRATHRLTLPVIDPALAPLATAVPLQRLALALARLGGLDPDTRRHLRDDEPRFRASRLLTRRSLLGTGQ